MNNKIVICIAMVGIIFTLSGCVNHEARLIKAGYPPSYAKGWAEGDESAAAAERVMGYYWKKDVRLYDADSQYKQGWDDGFAAGRANQESIRSSLNSSR